MANNKVIAFTAVTIIALASGSSELIETWWRCICVQGIQRRHTTLTHNYGAPGEFQTGSWKYGEYEPGAPCNRPFHNAAPIENSTRTVVHAYSSKAAHRSKIPLHATINLRWTRSRMLLKITSLRSYSTKKTLIVRHLPS